MHYYPHNISDFNSDTRHLTRLERSVYRDLIDAYYDAEEPFKVSELPKIARKALIVTEEEKEAMQYILDEFFIKDGEVYRHKRCDEEIQKYNAKSDKARNSAQKRWAKKETQSKGNAVAMQMQSETHANAVNKQSDSSAMEMRTHSERNTNAMRTHSDGNANGMLTNNQEPITNIKEKTDKKENQAAVQGGGVSVFCEPEKIHPDEMPEVVKTRVAIINYCQSQGIHAITGLPLNKLIERGAGLEHFIDAVKTAREKGNSRWSYVMGIVNNMLEDMSPPIDRGKSSPAVSQKFDPLNYIDQQANSSQKIIDITPIEGEHYALINH